MPAVKPIVWSQAVVGWDGRSYNAELPIALDPVPARWLETNAGRVAQRLGVPEVKIIPAVPSATGYSQVGAILLLHLPEPVPNAGHVKQILEAAIDDAYKAAEEAELTAAAFERTLRELDQ